MRLKTSERAALLATITHELAPGSFLKRPYFPDLLNQPDLLIVLEPGKLIALYIYDFGERITWHLTLGAVEDLFEVKTSVGPQTIVAAIASVPQELGEHHRDMIRLIQNTFDDVFIVDGDGNNIASDWHLRRRFFGAEPRVRLSHLWLEESLHQRELLERGFRATALAPLTDKNWRASGQNLRQVKDILFERLQVDTGGPIIRDPLVESVKPYIGGLKTSYRLKFDFRIEAHRPAVVDAVKGGRYGMRQRLRYLTVKARLMRYGVNEDGIFTRQPDYRPLLVVDGNMAGPDHDPLRYVRALVRAGWNVARADQPEDISNMIKNENL